MALAENNTFALPTAAKSLALSRIDYNKSHRATLANFYSAAAPSSINFTVEGDQITPPNGTLFKSSLTGRLYVRDSVFEKGDSVYGSDWTTNGLGPFVEDSLATANIDAYEIGELFVTVVSNTRMYMKSSNSGDIIDVGLPISNSLTGDKFVNGSITTDKIANASLANIDFVLSTIYSDKVAANTISNTNIVFDGIISNNFANSSIVTNKILANNISTAKIADDNITSIKIANNTVTTNDIANSAVTTAKIANEAITLAKIDPTMLIEEITGTIMYTEVRNFNLDLEAKYSYDIVELTVISETLSGTCSVSINGTAVTGIDAVTWDATERTYTATALDSVNIGDVVTFDIDTAGGLTDLFYTIEIVRT